MLPGMRITFGLLQNSCCPNWASMRTVGNFLGILDPQQRTARWRPLTVWNLNSLWPKSLELAQRPWALVIGMTVQEVLLSNSCRGGLVIQLGHWDSARSETRSPGKCSAPHCAVCCRHLLRLLPRTATVALWLNQACSPRRWKGALLVSSCTGRCESLSEASGDAG